MISDDFANETPAKVNQFTCDTQSKKGSVITTTTKKAILKVSDLFEKFYQEPSLEILKELNNVSDSLDKDVVSCFLSRFRYDFFFDLFLLVDEEQFTIQILRSIGCACYEVSIPEEILTEDILIRIINEVSEGSESAQYYAIKIIKSILCNAHIIEFCLENHLLDVLYSKELTPKIMDVLLQISNEHFHITKKYSDEIYIFIKRAFSLSSNGVDLQDDIASILEIASNILSILLKNNFIELDKSMLSQLFYLKDSDVIALQVAAFSAIEFIAELPLDFICEIIQKFQQYPIPIQIVSARILAKYPIEMEQIAGTKILNILVNFTKDAKYKVRAELALPIISYISSSGRFTEESIKILTDLIEVPQLASSIIELFVLLFSNESILEESKQELKVFLNDIPIRINDIERESWFSDDEQLAEKCDILLEFIDN